MGLKLSERYVELGSNTVLTSGLEAVNDQAKDVRSFVRSEDMLDWM